MTGSESPREGRPTWREIAAMPGRRVFVAVPLSDDAVTRVANLVDGVRAGTDPERRRRGRDVRWVRLDGLHLTLRFLGPTLDDRLPSVVEAARTAAGAHPPFELRLDGAGAFPNPERPRALWLAVTDGATELAGLAEGLDQALVAAGWPASDRTFQPHLTLARSDGVPAGAAVAARLEEAARGLDVASWVDRIVVFESITGGGPARYVALETLRLQGPSAAQ